MPSTNSPAGPSFRVSTESDGDTLIVTALGDLDIAAAERFQEELASVLAKGGSVVLLDLSKLDFIDSSGLPDHPMMIGITNWQQQVPLPQPYAGNNAWRIPLRPRMAVLQWRAIKP